MSNQSYCEGVSVVICCYNSASRLPETLRYIAQQRVEVGTPWEVIVVNNNSTDNTQSVAQSVWNKEKSPVFLSIVDEPKPGLTHARHRGFIISRYEYVLFCDDDNWLSEGYIQTAYEIMKSNPLIGALGGKGEGVCETIPPAWYHRLGIYVYAINAQAEKTGEVPRGMVYGAGATFRKSLYLFLINHGFNSMLSDRKGKELSSGGDDELCYALRLIEYKIWYDDRLTFQHFIPKERLNWQYLREFFVGSAKSTNVLSPFADILNKKQYIKTRLRKYYSLFKVFEFLRKELLPFYKKRILDKPTKIDDVELLAFYAQRLRAMHWLRFWEYNNNLEKILLLAKRLKKLPNNNR